MSNSMQNVSNCDQSGFLKVPYKTVVSILCLTSLSLAYMTMALSASAPILLAFLALFVPSVVPECRTFSACPLDNDWYVKTPRTWHTSEADNIPQTSVVGIPNSKTQSGSGSEKFCWTSTFSINKAPMSQPLEATCTYDKNAADYVCVRPESGTKSALFQNWPSTMKVTVVMTDNSTYAVLGSCMSGKEETWMVMSTSENGPPEEVMEEVKKMFPPRKDKTKTTATYRIGKKTEYFKCGSKDGAVAPPAPSLESVQGFEDSIGELGR